MKFPIIAIEDESFDIKEPSVLYRDKLTIQVKNLKKHFLQYTYCDSNGDLHKFVDFKVSDEDPKLGCNPFSYYYNFKIVILEFGKTGNKLTENDLRRTIRKNADKLHFVKTKQDKTELFIALDAAKTFRELIECIYAAEWTEEEDQLYEEKA
ncbi:MAG: hypothetical protein GQ574_00565 [Crocinitomix sp.]|nr:hypothetical protein [Crocinitomix sp.]